MYIISQILIGIAPIIYAWYVNRTNIVWWEFVINIAVSSLLAIGTYHLYSFSVSSDTEYWGDMVEYVQWDQEYQSYEWNPCCRTYECSCSTDKDGNRSCSTCCDGCYECNTYPERFYKVGRSGTKYEISGSEYDRLKYKFGTKEQDLGFYTDVDFDGWNCGYNGKRFIVKWDGNPDKAENAVSTHQYENKVVYSSSVYKPRKVTKKEKEKYKLHDYPHVIDYYQNDLIGYYDQEVTQKLTYFNALNGYRKQIKVMVFVHYSDNPDVLYMQRHYLKNGNKNEFNILLAIKDNRIIDMDFATWCKVPATKNRIKEFLANNPDSTVKELVDYSLQVLDKHWKRTEFTPLNAMVSIVPPIWYWLLILLVNLSISLFITFKFVHNEHVL